MKPFSKSDKANDNYVASIVRLNVIRKHSNADKLQCATIFGNNVIIGLGIEVGDIGIYFQPESAISTDYLAKTNSFRQKELNADKEKAGFFESTGRCRTVKLRGENSVGYFVPYSDFVKTYPQLSQDVRNIGDLVGTEFDTLYGNLLVKKYQIASQRSQGSPKERLAAKEKLESKLVDNQFRFHIDTPQFAKNAFKVAPADQIVITKKLHGSSFISAKLLVKRQLNWKERIAKWLGVPVVETEYDYLWSSRKVIKNEYFRPALNKARPSYYKVDLWEVVHKKVEHALVDGMTIYGEVVGYTPDGGYSQKGFDYGCEPGSLCAYIYRITMTSVKGKVFEFPWEQVKAWCELNGLMTVPELYSGLAQNLFPALDKTTAWSDEFLRHLQLKYLEKDCTICKNRVPDEGVVLRRQDTLHFDVYKLKSVAFLAFETKLLDEGVLDMESAEGNES